MYCIIKCIVQGKQARVKNADLHHPSCTVAMLKRKSASPVLSVLTAILGGMPSISGVKNGRLFAFSACLDVCLDIGTSVSCILYPQRFA